MRNYLNEMRLHKAAMPLDNALQGPISASWSFSSFGFPNSLNIYIVYYIYERTQVAATTH